MRRAAARLAVGLACAFVGPCAAATMAPAPAAFSAPPAGPAAGVEDAWWRVFGDPALDALIDQVHAGSTSIREAAARLAQARAQTRAAGAARWPQASTSAEGSHRSGPLINAAGGVGDFFSLGGEFAYEVDILGRLGKAEKAAKLDASSREALLRSARLLAEAETAQAYFQIRALDEELALLRATADSDRESVALMESGLKSGVEPEFAVARAQAELGAVESEGLEVARRRAETEHALAYLTGQSATDFRLAPGALPEAPPVIPPGVPSAVIARRPDIAAATDALEASRVRLGIARTAWMPSLTLTTSAGYASSELGDLLRASAQSLGVGAVVLAPLLDGGRRKAGVMGARADADLAAAQYQGRILAALREVEDQLSALRSLAEQDEVLRRVVAADARATRSLESRQAAGLIGRLDVLDAHRAALRNRRAAVQAHAQRFVATVGLVRALGGGWDTSAEP